MKLCAISFLIVCVQGFSTLNGKLATDKSNEAQYLRYKNGSLVSNHGLNVRLKVPKEYSFKPIINYEANFNNHPFYVSFAPFISGEKFLSVHAEAVTDNSGYLNYSHLEEVHINEIVFYKEDRCVQLDDNAINSMNDLRYVTKLGFDFKRPVYIAQYFKHSNDGNKEYVLTLGQYVDDCNMIDHVKKIITNEVQQEIDIKLIRS